MVSGTARRLFGGVVHAFVLIAFSLLLAFPDYWMLITIFKTTNDLYDLRNDPFKFNEKPTLEHLQLLFHDTLYLRCVPHPAQVKRVMEKQLQVFEGWLFIEFERVVPQVIKIVSGLEDRDQHPVVRKGQEQGEG